MIMKLGAIAILLASGWAGADMTEETALVRIVFSAEDGPVAANIAQLLRREIEARSGATVSFEKTAPLRVELKIAPGPGLEGYTIAEDENGVFQISGHDARGLLYGAGKFLRDGQYSDEGFTPGKWRGSSRPGKPIRGVYFATHFHNYYHDAPLPEVQRYVQELGLWGFNTVMVWYDMHHFNGWDDPKAIAFRARLRAIHTAAKDVGMDVGFGVVANEGYGNSPEALRADMSGMRGAMMPSDICTSKAEGRAYVLANFEQLFEWASDLEPGFAWIWPYDSGGCGCEQCQPWGHGGFLRMAEPLSHLLRRKVPGIQVILSTWFLDETEWEGLSGVFSEPPDWVDYLLAEPHAPAFTVKAPGGLPLVGFPEISMNGMWPWGGFGANPQPANCANYWSAVKEKAAGGFPYSEGIYEDVNKVIITQLYWSPDRDVADILREYIAYEFSPEVTDEILAIIQTLDRNHRFRWWPGLLEDYTGWFPSKGAAPQDDPGAEAAYATAQAVDKTLRPSVRTSWRWRIVYLRSLLDSELKQNGGRPNDACERAFEELTHIHHAENAIVDLKPPAGSDGPSK